MWTDWMFWKDATWRAFRTLCQSLAGLLTVNQVSSAFNAQWRDLLGAALIAGLVSLLQSIDRERAVGSAAETQTPAVTQPDVYGDPTAQYGVPSFTIAPGPGAGHVYGESLR